ncbi:MAG: transcriptional regulator, partial [Asticcacaulis sp.]
DKLLAGTGTVTSAYSGSYDAFALSVDADLTKTASDKIAYYGGAGTEKNAQVQFSNGKAWIAGQTTGAITGTTQIGKADAYLARLNIDTGQVEYQTRYSGTDGQVSPDSLAVSSGSSSVLDKLGLPMGTVLQTDSPYIVANSSVRTGDQFFMVDPQSGAKKTITIDATDTMKTLAAKIQRASGFQLTVTTTSVPGVNGQPSTQGLDIKPANNSSSLEFVAGPVGKDALTGLGLASGLVTSQAGKLMDPTTSNYTTSQKPMGLIFDTSLNLNSTQNIADAVKSLQKTIQKVHEVYTYLKSGDPQPKKPGSGNGSGAPPAYLTNEIANYQAALQRLTGGS